MLLDFLGYEAGVGAPVERKIQVKSERHHAIASGEPSSSDDEFSRKIYEPTEDYGCPLGSVNDGQYLYVYLHLAIFGVAQLHSPHSEHKLPCCQRT